MFSKNKNSPYSFIIAMVVGVVLAVGGSVWATSVGTNVTVTGKLAVDSASASSTVTYAFGVGTSTPSVIFSVGGAAGNATGHGYFTGGLGVGAISTTAGRILANVSLGVATTTPATELSIVGSTYTTLGLGVGVATSTAGAIENSGNVLFGDASGDLVMFNSASLIFNNAGTSTIPSANLNAWNIATSTAGVPFLKYNTSTYRIGIGTTSPATTLSVGGDGHIYALGGLGVGRATTTAGAIENSGNVLFGDASGDLVMSNSANWVMNNAGTTTIPSADANAWSLATTTSGAFVRFNTSTTRVGISSSTPGATLAIEGDGTAIISGGATSTLVIQSTGAGQKGGCIQIESSEGGGTSFYLIATTSGFVLWNSGTCR